MENNRVMPDQVKPGCTIFRVTAPGHRPPRVEELLVKTAPRPHGTNGAMAFKAQQVIDGKPRRFESFCTLQDFGIIINDYNMSMTFHDRANAEAYRDRLIRQDLTAFEHKRLTKVRIHNLHKFLNG